MRALALSLRATQLAQMLAMLKQPTIQEMLGAGRRRPAAASAAAADAPKPHRFWDTQPVPKLGESHCVRRGGVW